MIKFIIDIFKHDEDEESFQDKEENKATSSDKTKKNQEIIKLNF